MEGGPLISADVLARYAGDAAREVEGVSGLSEHALLRSKGVAVTGADGSPTVEVHIELEWGRSGAEVAREVQSRVLDYLARMANVTPAAVDVVVAGVSSPPAKR